MGNRNVHSPSCIFGIRQGFNIADLVVPYTGPIHAITAAVTTTTSDSIAVSCRSVTIYATFAKQNTTCDVVVANTNGTLATFLGVNFETGSLNVGGYENIDLQALPFTVTIQNITNASAIDVYVQVTS